MISLMEDLKSQVGLDAPADVNSIFIWDQSLPSMTFSDIPKYFRKSLHSWMFSLHCSDNSNNTEAKTSEMKIYDWVDSLQIAAAVQR